MSRIRANDLRQGDATTRSASPTATAVQFVQRFFAARTELERLPCDGYRDLPVVTGITPSATCYRPWDVVLAEVTEILVASCRIYRLHGDVYLETLDCENPTLLPLTANGVVNSGADSRLSNVFSCAMSPPTEDYDEEE